MNPKQPSLENLWGLDEPLRFPVSNYGWSTMPPIRAESTLPPVPEPFASVLTLRTAAETAAMVATLTVAAPGDFSAASAAITPAGWRQLYYRGNYVIDCLASRRFHAEYALRVICEQSNPTEDPPEEWLGTSSLPGDVATDTAYALRQVGREVAMAAWAVLAVAQAIPLAKTEILHCKWWDPVWIQSLSSHLKSR